MRKPQRFQGSDIVLTEKEKLVLIRIQNVYTSELKVKLSDHLALNFGDSLPSDVLNFIKFPTNNNYWNVQLGKGSLSEDARSLRNRIIEFMQSFSEDSREVDTTVSIFMFCHEFLIWVTQTLSKASINKEFINETKKRFAYLTRLQDEQLLLSEEAGDFETRNVLINALFSDLSKKLSSLIADLEKRIKLKKSSDNRFAKEKSNLEAGVGERSLIRYGDVEYIRYPVEISGTSCYRIFGLDRNEAYELLLANKDTVSAIIKPVLGLVLFKSHDFVDWLPNGFENVKQVSKLYFELLAISDVDIFTHQALENHCRDRDSRLVHQYLDYDVLKGLVDNGWPYPYVLYALANILNYKLCLYEIDNSGNMIPHRRCPGYTPTDATQTIELLYVEGNRFEKLEPKSSLLNDSTRSKEEYPSDDDAFSSTSFAGGATIFLPSSKQKDDHGAEFIFSSDAEEDSRLNSPK